MAANKALTAAGCEASQACVGASSSSELVGIAGQQPNLHPSLRENPCERGAEAVADADDESGSVGWRHGLSFWMTPSRRAGLAKPVRGRASPYRPPVKDPLTMPQHDCAQTRWDECTMAGMSLREAARETGRSKGAILRGHPGGGT